MCNLIESFLFPLVTHHSHKNKSDDAIQGCNPPSRKCTIYSWIVQQIVVQYSPLSPLTGQEFCRACNKSFKHVLVQTCAWTFAFSQRYSTQFIAESRFVSRCVIFSKKKEKLFTIQQLCQEVHVPSCALKHRICCVPASEGGSAATLQHFKAKYGWCLEKV